MRHPYGRERGDRAHRRLRINRRITTRAADVGRPPVAAHSGSDRRLSFRSGSQDTCDCL